jgi:hypothetical protein
MSTFLGAFADIDRHALSTPKEETETVERLSQYLAQPAKSDIEKYRAFYRWITEAPLIQFP